MRSVVTMIIILLIPSIVNAAIPNFHQVSPGIYRSGLLDRNNIDELTPYGIKSIISLKTNPFEVAVERDWALSHGIDFVNIPIQMLLYTQETKNQFWQANFAMATKKKPLLLHCTRGSERTGISIAMYRIIYQHWPIEKALAEMDYYGYNPVFWYWKFFLRNEV